jgi:hypothetical protein
METLINVVKPMVEEQARPGAEVPA